ncbi:hypothetical protein E3V36_04505 [Candidatus Marinimicrobia bacterium MT.SAG.2]|nr:hypothetical protein E3V36_04505 [Candidatus Marinimicrobia bacterium MT.SAG.2]
MKRKKKIQRSLTGSLVMTAEEFAKLRGLDPEILEREALSFGFGAIISGMCNINVTQYDAWVIEEIRSGGTDIKKPVSRKNLSEVNNTGILNANITRLSALLKADEADLDWLGKQIIQTTDEIDGKKLQVKQKRLEEKISKKTDLIETAKVRLVHLLDAELGESGQSE